MAAAGDIRVAATKASCWPRAARFFWRLERCIYLGIGARMAFSYIFSSALRRNAIGG